MCSWEYPIPKKTFWPSIPCYHVTLHGPLRRRRLNVELLKQKSDSRKRNITQPNQVWLLNIRQSKNNNLSERATHILRVIKICLKLRDISLDWVYVCILWQRRLVRQEWRRTISREITWCFIFYHYSIESLKLVKTN